MRRIRRLAPSLMTLLFTGCLTRGIDMPIGTRLMAEAYFGYGRLTAAIGPARPKAPEGFESELFRDLGDTTAVGLDVDPFGDVYVAVSDRQRGGVSDNRFKPYWLLDDLAAESVDDRRAYIEKWAARGRDPISWYTENADRVLRLRDADGDGEAEQVDELARFHDLLTGIGSAVLVDGRTIWFTDIPDLWRLEDADGDGVAELRERVATGFGVATSLGGHDLHGLTWGPDGRIYFSVGDRGYNVKTAEGRVLHPPMVVSRGAVFRMQPDGSELEVFATGLRNPQDLAFDDYGNLFTGDNNGDGADEARLVHVVEGGDTGWAMPVQTMEGDYFHGPWEAERLWEVQHEGQPAWVLPPIGYIGRGPAGVAIDPGLGGLHERFGGQILICDYQYAKVRSGVHAHAVEPKGAGFRLAGITPVFESLLPTDIVFGDDGRIYISEFDQFLGGSAIHRFTNPAHLADPRVAELTELLREGFAGRSVEELVALLGHVDRRARRGAQHELALRGAAEALGEVVRDRAAPELARIHAIWGLGQLGAEGLRRAGWRDLVWTRSEAAEIRAQALRIAGEARAAWLRPELVAALADDAQPRAQALAANSLGRLADSEAIGPLIELLRRNRARDVFLRHAAVHALERMRDLDRVLAFADDESASVRLGVLLVLRRHEDARIARFLHDREPRLVVEAARAIYDLDLRDALPALAALAESELLLDDDGDRQSTHALHRRVIAANLALGTRVHAEAIAAHLVRASTPATMRAVALDALAEFVEPGPREPVFGFYRAWSPRAPDTIHAALDRVVPALVGTPLEARALEIALAAGRVPLPDDELLARLEGWFEPESVKVASLRVLAERRSPRLDEAVELALGSRRPALRAQARDVLAETHPGAAVDAVDSLSERAPRVERQRAYATLAAVGNDAADARLRADLVRLQDGSLDPAVALDLLEAVRARAPELAEELSAYESALPRGDLLAARRVALEGGDAVAGRRVFESAGDCLRCHAGESGHGGGSAGPNLSGIGRRRDRSYLLESVVDPQAEIAAGFGTVSLVLRDGEAVIGTLVRESDEALTLEIGGDPRVIARSEIASARDPSSAMPPMGLALSLPQLRDLIEYLATL